MNYSSGTRDLEYGFLLKNISENFQTESGYINRNGIFRVTGFVKPKIYPNSDIFRRIDIALLSAQTNDKFSNQWETYNWLAASSIFPNNFVFTVKYSISTEIYLGEKFKTGGFHIYTGGWLYNQFYIDVLYRRIGAIYYSQSPFQGKSNVLASSIAFLPLDNLRADLDFIYYDFYKEDDDQKVYDYPISRAKISYQLNKYFLFRAIGEYNAYKEELLLDFLASFTYIPGTVFHLGYGSLYNKIDWQNNSYVENNQFKETKRGFFLKVSYLWRM